jgi:hypothetical protein
MPGCPRDRTRHEACEPGEHGTEPEYQCVKQANIDAERRHHRAVGRPGADQHPQARVPDHEPEQDRDGESDCDDREPVERIAQAGEKLHMPRKVLGDARIDRRAAPEDRHQLVEKEDQAEGGEHLVEVIALVQRAQATNDDDPHHQSSREPEQDAEHERPGQLEKYREISPPCRGSRGRG